MSYKVGKRNETYRSVGGERGETSLREGEVMHRQCRGRQSVADVEKSNSTVVTTSGIVKNGSYRHRLRMVRWVCAQIGGVLNRRRCALNRCAQSRCQNWCAQVGSYRRFKWFLNRCAQESLQMVLIGNGLDSYR